VNGTLYSQVGVSGTSTTRSFIWDTRMLAPGVYTLVAKAYDKAGNIATCTISVTVISR
jgi:hypothetical protein